MHIRCETTHSQKKKTKTFFAVYSLFKMIPLEVFIALSALAGLLHIIGICLLFMVKTLPQNQKLLLMNLSAIEMVLNWLRVAKYSIVKETETMDTHFLDPFFIFMETLSVFSMRFAILHIIGDRFLEVYLNIKYPLYMNSKRNKQILAIMWLFSIIFAVTRLLLYLFHSDIRNNVKFYDTTILILDLLIFTSSMATYLYFYIMVRKIHQQNTTRKSTLKRFKVPFLVVLTFILFNITGTIMLTVASYCLFTEHVELILLHSSIFLDIVGCISDACIYLFIQKEIRKICLVFVGKVNRDRSRINSSIEDQGT